MKTPMKISTISNLNTINFQNTALISNPHLSQHPKRISHHNLHRIYPTETNRTDTATKESHPRPRESPLSQQWPFFAHYRYIAVTQPIKYAKHKNNRRVWLTIVLVWAISAAIGSPIVLGLNNTPDRLPDLCLFYNSDFIIYSSLSSFYIPCIIMVFLYYSIFKVWPFFYSFLIDVFVIRCDWDGWVFGWNRIERKWLICLWKSIYWKLKEGVRNWWYFLKQ